MDRDIDMPDIIKTLAELGGLIGRANPSASVAAPQGQRPYGTNDVQIPAEPLALAKRADYQRRLAAFITDPTPKNATILQRVHPDHHAAIKAAWNRQSDPQQAASLADIGTIFAALHHGRADLAKAAIQRHIDVAPDSGADVSPYHDMITLIDDDPHQAAGTAALLLTSVAGIGRYAQMLNQLRRSYARDGDGRQPGDTVDATTPTQNEATKGQP
jgi:hypothetical protein